jgi:hypothetical protein
LSGETEETRENLSKKKQSDASLIICNGEGLHINEHCFCTDLKIAEVTSNLNNVYGEHS